MRNEATESNPVGCTGIVVTDSGQCLAHAGPDEQRAYLASLRPGADLDLRGTTVTEELLGRLRARVTDSGTGVAEIGAAAFDSAVFEGDAWFGRAHFAGDASFAAARFAGGTSFEGVAFDGVARFDSAVFTADACFTKAEFGTEARFDSAVFGTDAVFDGVRFQNAPDWGPILCLGTLDLSAAVFGAPVVMRITAKRVLCRRTQWSRTSKLWLRYADVDMTDAVLDETLVVATEERRFTGLTGPVDDSVLGTSERVPALLKGEKAGVPRIMSLRGVDAAQLVVANLNLGRCLFCGTIRLDQLRMEGRCPFVLYQPGIRWFGVIPVRVSQRLLIAEEQHWRAKYRSSRGWLPAPHDDTPIPDPPALASLYRALRKSYEEARNEPGASDFYYGEMEMRRFDGSFARAERILLTVYWALSGYGLRAARTLAWLLFAMGVTMLGMMLWGLPGNDISSHSTGTVTGRHIALTTDTATPVDPTGPLTGRLTTRRFEGSLRVVVNSVVFRSSGQDLTTAGTYIEMASRLTEPVLLGLAAFAVRGRIKR